MITVVIPTIRGREEWLRRAVRSVNTQTLSPTAVEVERDEYRRGAADTRNIVLRRVVTEWVAFLDDDDLFYPQHLQTCLDHAYLTGADVVYPGYDVLGGEDKVRRFGQPFNPDLLRRGNYIPVTTVCRTDMVRAAGGFQVHPDESGFPCEDWGLWLAMLDAGAVFSHLPRRTWLWSVHVGNTWGRGVNRQLAWS